MDRSTTPRRRTGRGSAWKVMAATALITGALGTGTALASAPGVTLPLPALQHGAAQGHVPTPHEPVLAGSRWGSEPASTDTVAMGVAWK